MKLVQFHITSKMPADRCSVALEPKLLADLPMIKKEYHNFRTVFDFTKKKELLCKGRIVT